MNENTELNELLKKLNFEIYSMDVPEGDDIKVEYIKFVRKNITKSLNALTGIMTAAKTLFGGNLLFYNTLLNKTREEALLTLVKEAVEDGANAIVGLRIDTTIAQGIIDVFCYGTAIKVSKTKK